MGHAPWGRLRFGKTHERKVDNMKEAVAVARAHGGHALMHSMGDKRTQNASPCFNGAAVVMAFTQVQCNGKLVRVSKMFLGPFVNVLNYS